MPVRTVTVDGMAWQVEPSGLVTANDRDEFGLRFTRELPGGGRESRYSRYSPETTRSRERSFAELSDEQLAVCLVQSQPSIFAPEGKYGAR